MEREPGGDGRPDRETSGPRPAVLVSQKQHIRKTLHVQREDTGCRVQAEATGAHVYFLLQMNLEDFRETRKKGRR